MAAVGGSLIDISIAGRLFPVAADVDASINTGGMETELEPNGDGSARQIMKRVAWGVEGIDVEIDDDRADLEFLQDISDAPDFVPISLTGVSGITWSGSGKVIGEIKKSTQKSSASIKLGGPGKLEQQ